MPFGTGLPGEDFSARVIYEAPGIVPQMWATTHEFSSNGGGTIDADFKAFADVLMDFHRALLVPSFRINRIVLSTLAADSTPYDVTKLAVYQYDEFGQREVATDVVPLWNCLLVKRLVTGGRLGNMLIRGMLTEGDLNSPGGVPGLADKDGLNTELVNSIAASGLNGYFVPDATNLQLYMITLGEINNVERAVEGFNVSRLTYKKLNNKYFDKGIL